MGRAHTLSLSFLVSGSIFSGEVMAATLLIIRCAYGSGVLSAAGAAAALGDNKPDTMRFLFLSWLAFGFLLCDGIQTRAQQRKIE